MEQQGLHERVEEVDESSYIVSQDKYDKDTRYLDNNED